MRLPQQIGISQAERYIGEIANRFGSTDLELPLGIKYLGAGAEAALIQLLLTWANKSDSRRLILPKLTSPEEYADRLVSRLFGRVAALICTSAHLKGSQSDVSRILKARAEKIILDRYYKYEVSRQNVSARAVSVLCVDTVGYGEPRTVYEEDMSGKPAVKSVSGFVKLAEQAIGSIIQDYEQRGLTVDRDFVRALGSLLFELFSNTHDHARYNFDGKPRRISARGFQIRVHESDDLALRNMAEGYEPLSHYIRQLPAIITRNRQLLEVSVFDSGPGFAQQRLKRSLEDVSLDQEREAVDECFVRGSTTKAHSRYGQGLPQVVALLRARSGFMHLRTGRLSLHRNLGIEREWSRETVPQFEYWDPEGSSGSAKVAGTLVTLIMPVGRIQ